MSSAASDAEKSVGKDKAEDVSVRVAEVNASGHVRWLCA